MVQTPFVVHLDTIEGYSPPMHAGTVNKKLVPAALGAGFEMAHGTIEPGGIAHRHQHDTEWQVFVILEGEGRLEMGEEPAQTLGPGSVVRIPPKTPHYFEVTGESPAKLIVIYSPPLGENGFVPA